MAEINLLQGERHSSFSKIHLPVPVGTGRGLLLIMLGLIVVEGLVWGGIWWWKISITNNVTEVQGQLHQLNADLKSQSIQARQAIISQSSLVSFSALLDKHLYWTQLWKELGKVTLKTLRYSGIQASAETGQFTVKGEAANYTELGKALLGLQTSSVFSGVELKSTSPAEAQKTGVKFEILVKMKPSVLQGSFSAPSASSTPRTK